MGCNPVIPSEGKVKDVVEDVDENEVENEVEIVLQRRLNQYKINLIGVPSL